jgi:hypothetical protein
VLRAKVSVFVELWNKSRQLSAHAEAVRERETRWRSLSDAVEAATGLLRSDEPDARDRAIELLEQARWGAVS